MVDPIKLAVDSALEVEGREDTPQLTVKGHATQTEPLQSWQDQNGETLAQIGAGGQLQIGGEPGTPEALIEVHQTVSLPSTQPRRGWWSVGQMVGSLSQSISDAITWIAHELQLSGEGDVSGLHTALRAALRLEASGDVTQAEGRAGDFQAENRSGSTGTEAGQLTGVRGTIDNGIDAYLDRAVGVEAALFNDGDITEAAAFEVAPPGNNGTIDTLVGLKVPDLDQGEDNYAIHTGKGVAHFGDMLEMEAVDEPGTPPQDVLRLYTKSDGKPYAKNWSGTEYDLTSGTGGANPQIVTGTAGENLVQGDIVYLNASDQKWYKVDIDASPVLVSTDRGVATETINVSGTGSIQIGGLSDDFSGLTPGSDVWASTTAGGYTQTKPNPSGGGGQVAVVRIGTAVSSTEVLLDLKTPVRYLERESLPNGSSLTIEHHSDVAGYSRKARAYIATSVAGSTLASYADSNQDEDVGLKQQEPGVGSDECVGGTPTADSTYGGLGAPFAFDDDTGTIWGSGANLPHWLKYDFGEGNEKTIVKYRIHYNDDYPSWNYYIYSPNTWTFQGSNDNYTWDTLDSQDNQAWSADGWKEYEFSNSTAYRYYRLYITNVQDGGGHAAIHEIEMMETGTPTDGPTELAQGFQVTGAQTVETVKLWLKKVGSPTGNLTVEIQTDSSGDPSGTPVTNGTSDTVAASSLSTGYGWIGFTFSTPPSLSGSTQYHLVLKTTDSQSQTDYVVWGADGSSPSYSNGEMKSYDSGWSSESKDACFGVYGPGTSYESPCLIDDWSTSLAVVACRYDDGSGADADTKTTFKNKVGATIDVTFEVEVP